MDMFRKVHAQDSHAKLFLNEYGIVVNSNKAVVRYFLVFNSPHTRKANSTRMRQTVYSILFKRK